MASNRIPKPNSQGAHDLVSHVPGKNRFQVGQVVCSCGETFTGINKFEQHQAHSRRIDKGESRG